MTFNNTLLSTPETVSARHSSAEDKPIRKSLMERANIKMIKPKNYEDYVQEFETTNDCERLNELVKILANWEINFKRQEDLIETVKEECEKDNIELFRNIHHNNQLLENLFKTIEREDILHHRVSQLETKIQKVTEKLDLVLDILQKKL